MKIIPSIEIGEAELIASNVPEDDAPEWEAGTEYTLGDRVILAAGHSVYQSNVADNLGNDPSAVDSTAWLRVGATKAWRAFDDVVSDPISQLGTISYTIKPASLVRGVGLVRVSAALATVRVLTPSGQELVSQTKYLADYSEMIDALAMVSIPPRQEDMTVFEDVICQPGNHLEITIGDGTGTAEVSEIVIGDTLEIGTSLFGVDLGIDDWSIADRDDFGNLSVVERDYNDRASIPVAVKTNDIPRIRRKLAALRAKLALYYVSASGNDFGATIYGKYASFRILISGPNTSDAEIEIEGVI
ncbi:MAG: hypothetical protein JXR13_18765 [Thalassovita sp.]